MTALLIVDVQNDFMPGGALGVPQGDQIIPIINNLTQLPFDLIIATKDWHPANHGSFAPTHRKNPGDHVQLNGLDQILWPVHCVQNTTGSEFAPGLDTSRFNHVFYKGVDPSVDSYSAFFDNAHRRSTGLSDYLRENNITDLYIAGLATDYCVKYSIHDALELGFHTHIIVDGCRGINLSPGDVDRALSEMRSSGASLVSSANLSLPS